MTRLDYTTKRSTPIDGMMNLLVGSVAFVSDRTSEGFRRDAILTVCCLFFKTKKEKCDDVLVVSIQGNRSTTTKDG